MTYYELHGRAIHMKYYKLRGWADENTVWLVASTSHSEALRKAEAGLFVPVDKVDTVMNWDPQDKEVFAERSDRHHSTPK